MAICIVMQANLLEGEAMGEKVTGQALIERVMWFVLRYVHFASVPATNEAQGLIVAMWIVGTWISERLPIAPYLHFSAPGPGCGKTIGLEMCELVVHEPSEVNSTVRALAMVRWIEELSERFGGVEGVGVWLQDEAEKLSKPTANDERSIFTTGYRKGGRHGITVGSRRVTFGTFCWKAFSSIGDLINVLRDRCIVLYLEKGKPAGNLTVDKMTGAANVEAEEIKDWIRIVMGDLHPELVIPTWLDGRDAEVWAPIFSIAAALHLDKKTIGMLKAASVDLSAAKKAPPRKFFDLKADDAEHDRTYGERAIRDVLTVARGKGGKLERITTEDALAALKALPESPWRNYRGVGLTAVTLAALVSRFGLKSVRLVSGPKGNQVQRQGWTVAMLENAARFVEASDRTDALTAVAEIVAKAVKG